MEMKAKRKRNLRTERSDVCGVEFVLSVNAHFTRRTCLTPYVVFVGGFGVNMAKFIHIAPSEEKTGYTPRKSGNEHCSNCEYFVESEGGCKGPSMMKLSERPKLANGHVKVQPTGWCKFWDGE